MDELDELIDDVIRAAQEIPLALEWGTGSDTVRHELERVKAALRTRITELEEAYAALVAINDTNRTLAEDWKQARRNARAAERDGYGVEWWGENGDYLANLENNIIERLLRP